MSYLEINNVSVGFGPVGNRYEVLTDLNLSVEENEFVAVVGFSGAGKSTLISLLAGLLQPDTGEVRIGGKVITEPSPRLGIMFQNYSLLPWLTVFENVALAVKQVFPKYSKAELREHVEKYVAMVKLSPALDKKPSELSGGMRQRASLARTLSMQPEVLLLDEPLSALDALTRAEIQDEIINIWESDRRTIVMITNDVDEAVLMADRIVPLTMGPSAKLDTPFPVNLARPRNRTTLNTNPEFRRLRNDIAKYMVTLNEESKALKSNQAVVDLPEIMPIDFTALPHRPAKGRRRQQLAKALSPETTFFK
ncbi:ABC transporter ATP-binding protein [Coraliomargarita akajimensis]|uniref:ABC transporter related protein n=1 Tax=Coraliomargarita akajimensis (strain DSM 45221 / IAM 15411 / JCM 23193 / KCTC 12865 / 04OKA010-24) TaxID=583355 RepID=D5EMG1_CORAD|nr:ABC transporter ATP-binding protein [Coraliomargarita akajimensis]ADE53367.1 ABC transporter related protein [Coraliomargarita akajimensis DSM 45221]